MNEAKKEYRKSRIDELNKKYAKKTPSKRFRSLPLAQKKYNIGLNLLSHMLVSIFIGVGLDTLFDTKPVFILIFLFLGFTAGIRQIYKETSKS